MDCREYFTWLGPTGSNNILGYVENKKLVGVPQDKIEFFKERGLIEENKKKKDKPLKKED